MASTRLRMFENGGDKRTLSHARLTSQTAVEKRTPVRRQSLFRDRDFGLLPHAVSRLRLPSPCWVCRGIESSLNLGQGARQFPRGHPARDSMHPCIEDFPGMMRLQCVVRRPPGNHGKLSFWEGTEWRKVKWDTSDYLAHWSKPKPHQKNVSWRKNSSARTGQRRIDTLSPRQGIPRSGSRPRVARPNASPWPDHTTPKATRLANGPLRAALSSAF